MNPHQLVPLLPLSPIYLGAAQEITCVYCCDLLSLAMVKAPKGCCWVTVIANRNTIAVAKHAEAACVILAEGISPSEEMCRSAERHQIPLFATELGAFAIARAADLLLHRHP